MKQHENYRFSICLKTSALGQVNNISICEVTFANDQIIMNINYNSKTIFHNRITGLSQSIKSLRSRVDI